ncbi:MAG: DUF86 domain-containing protein [Proteobacteria bacterium]|nr:DUF86 domain-containing protein [Pseudomonadota bacterium]
MYDTELVLEILDQIKTGAARIQRRFTKIRSADDFLSSDEGLDKLDAICMMLIAIGESLKNLDKITHTDLLVRYPDVDWKGAKGVRDIISHHYFDLDAEVIYTICRERIPALVDTVARMINDLHTSNA